MTALTPCLDTNNDELLVLTEACKIGDRKAQRRLYDLFAPKMYAKVRRYISDTHLAAEVLNESFFKVFRKLEDYKHEGSFEGWVHKIVLNTILDALRKTMSKRSFVEAEAAPDVESSTETGISKMAYKELLALVHSLPEAQRSVFNLFVFENFSHKEIAETLKITENNSRWHLNDARRRLKQKIESVS